MRRSGSPPLERARAVILDFPGVEEGTSYGTPGFKAYGKFLARMKEDGETLVVRCGFIERDLRIQHDPETFFITDHYRSYPALLIRMKRVRIADLHDIIEVAWRQLAPKRMVYALDERVGRRGPRTGRTSA